jgi:NAD(P)-dependent dehydrogenase (short-subunit alcohol dehydrogenase family)
LNYDDDIDNWGDKGLGKETARQLSAGGHTVWIGTRDEARGRAAAKELGSRFDQLDVTTTRPWPSPSRP